MNYIICFSQNSIQKYNEKIQTLVNLGTVIEYLGRIGLTMKLVIYSTSLFSMYDFTSFDTTSIGPALFNTTS